MAVAAQEFAPHYDPARGWIAESVNEAEKWAAAPTAALPQTPTSHRLPAESGVAMPLTQRTLDKARVTQLLCAYQEKARALEDAQSRLFQAAVRLEQNIVRGKERSLPGVPLDQHPQLVQARDDYIKAQAAEECYYIAWLVAINEYVGVSWENRVEILELAGWYTGVVRTGKSYDFVTHRDGSAAQFNSRLKAVLWLHPVMLRHGPDAD